MPSYNEAIFRMLPESNYLTIYQLILNLTILDFIIRLRQHNPLKE